MGDWTGVGGRWIVITGATNGIGLAAAEELAAKGAKLALVARSRERADEAVTRIRAAAGADATVEVLLADLALQRSVRGLAAEILERLPRVDVLINNAGAVIAGRRLTDEGVEMTWAVNHLAPFLLTTLLLDRMKADAPARIVTTASAAHVGSTAPLDDLDGERAYGGPVGASGFRRYGESKLANILFTSELARRLEGSGVTATCFHPGVVATGFNRNNGAFMRLSMTLMRPFTRTPRKGAETLVWLADSPDVEGQSGGYYVDRHLANPSAAARDAETARRLWEVSEEQVRASAPA